MSEERKIADNVWSFLDRASEAYGKIKAERFSQEMHSQLVEGGIASPIEDLFFVACQMQCLAEYVAVDPDCEFDNKGNICPGYGVTIQPQASIGMYRVDFLIIQHGIGPDDILSPVIVELDGHDFHDKDKRQRAYEKARDRFLVKSGYKVLHFTGSEVVADPYKVAFEALSLIGVFVSSREEYDAKAPLGEALDGAASIL